MRVKTGDTVEVITGKDKGKRGTILRALPREQRVVVEKVNLVKRHTKPNPQFPQGGIVTKEAPIHVSNVMIVCRHCKKRTRVGMTFNDQGKKLRTCKKCGEPLD
jgi:large subunit ribosomal protein L24